MQGLTTDDLITLFEPDMKRLVPGYVITWFMDEEWIDISLLVDDGGMCDGCIWCN